MCNLSLKIWILTPLKCETDLSYFKIMVLLITFTKSDLQFWKLENTLSQVIFNIIFYV